MSLGGDSCPIEASLDIALTDELNLTPRHGATDPEPRFPCVDNTNMHAARTCTGTGTHEAWGHGPGAQISLW